MTGFIVKKALLNDHHCKIKLHNSRDCELKLHNSRHSGTGRNPAISTTNWIPACAGMTGFIVKKALLNDHYCDLKLHSSRHCELKLHNRRHCGAGRNPEVITTS